MILLKDASLLQIFAAYTLLIGHSPKEETIIDYIKYRATSSTEADVTTVLNGYRETSSDTLHHVFNYKLPDITLVEAAQADARILSGAIVSIICKYYNKQKNTELIYSLEGEGIFKLEIHGEESYIHDAKKIMTELGYDKWRIWSYR